MSCYLDYNSLVLTSPQAVLVTDCFFLCSGNLVVRATSDTDSINGLSVIGNEFELCGNDTIIFDERNGKFTSVYDMYVAGNMVPFSDHLSPLTDTGNKRIQGQEHAGHRTAVQDTGHVVEIRLHGATA